MWTVSYVKQVWQYEQTKLPSFWSFYRVHNTFSAPEKFKSAVCYCMMDTKFWAMQSIEIRCIRDVEDDVLNKFL